jgi:hypothetical protein
MFRLIQFGCLLFFAFPHSYKSTFEAGILVLVVTDIKGNPVSNITLTCQGPCSQGIADNRGTVRLKLPPQTRPRDWIQLEIVKRPGGVDWVLISPWDGRAIVPSFENEAQNFVRIFGVRRGDKEILRDSNSVLPGNPKNI